jgi:hypothetical protein
MQVTWRLSKTKGTAELYPKRRSLSLTLIPVPLPRGRRGGGLPPALDPSLPLFLFARHSWRTYQAKPSGAGGHGDFSMWWSAALFAEGGDAVF